MPEEPSESSATGSDAAILGLDDSDLDPEPEISDDVTPVESPSEEEEEAEAEDKKVESEEPAEEKPEEAESAAPAETEESAESTPAPFKFLDKEYSDIGAAEHDWRSYLGQLRSKDEQIKELTGSLKNLNDHFESLQSHKEEAPAQSEGERKDAESKPKSFWDAFDFNAFEEEVENKGLGEGMQYLVYKVDEHLNSMKDELRQEMSGTVAPFQAWQEQMSEFNESYGYFQDLANRVDEKGEALYPELRGEDTAFIQRVGERWLNTFESGERKRLGAYGAHIAYVLQKAEEGITTASPEAPAPPPPEEPKKPGASEALKTLNRQANQGLSEGVLTGTSTVKPTSRRTSNDIVNSELEEWGEDVKEPLLGI